MLLPYQGPINLDLFKLRMQVVLQKNKRGTLPRKNKRYHGSSAKNKYCKEYEMYIKGRIYSIKDNYTFNKNNKTISVLTVFVLL